MIGKLLPVLLALIGLGAGIGGGMALRPVPEATVVMENPCGVVEHNAEDPHAAPDHTEETQNLTNDFVKLNNQFVVPVVDEGRVKSLVVLSLNLEVSPGQTDVIYQLEPKLRELFLRVLFDHANAGGFDGSFTKSTRMNALRTALRESAQKLLGDTVLDVLIIDVVRQDT